MERDLVERLRIREVIESWAVWRDAGDWERMATLWHDDGEMMATWFQGSAERFIELSREGWERGVRIFHSLRGTSVDLAGDRAIAQTKMSITQRAEVGGVLCDVVCTGRFYDFFERRNGRWGILLRQGIYEQDRLDSVEPGRTPTLDRERLAALREGYRHLAYVQIELGFDVKTDMPGLTGPEVEDLYRRGEDWLAGGDS